MRFFFGVGTKLFMWDTSVAKVNMRVSGGDDEDEEGYEQAPPMDPHSTLNCHAELSPNAVYGGSASARRMGFGVEAER
jgi:hypothetical protein